MILNTPALTKLRNLNNAEKKNSATTAAAATSATAVTTTTTTMTTATTTAAATTTAENNYSTNFASFEKFDSWVNFSSHEKKLMKRKF